MRKLSLITLIIVLLLTGCTHKKPINNLSADEFYEKAMIDFQNDRYNKAITNFKNVIFQYPGSDKMESAQYYIGESYFSMKKYADAINEYSFLINSFMGSSYYEDAKYKTALCYYHLSIKSILDQTDTKKAEELLKEFIEQYPGSKYREEAEEMIKCCHIKYIKKTLDSGKLYYKIGKYNAAIMYYEKALAMEDSDYMIEPIYEHFVLVYKKIKNKEKLSRYIEELDKLRMNKPLDK
jgi:outer membrane protein assembly factor BamD